MRQMQLDYLDRNPRNWCDVLIVTPLTSPWDADPNLSLKKSEVNSHVKSNYLILELSEVGKQGRVTLKLAQYNTNSFKFFCK